jgi:hypothetical protein
MLVADGGGFSTLATSVGAKAFTAEVDNLKTFRSRVDQMLQDLEGSPASQRQIAEQRLNAGHLGSGFGEAEDLLATYNAVHANLEQLSTTLSQQIEAMSITMDVSTKGYQSVEESRVEELWKIRDRTEATYKPPATTAASEGARSVATPSTGTKQGKI